MDRRGAAGRGGARRGEAQKSFALEKLDNVVTGIKPVCKLERCANREPCVMVCEGVRVSLCVCLVFV